MAPFDTLFSTPAYRRNAQVKTLDMIIAERTRVTAADPTFNAPASAVVTDEAEQGEYVIISIMYTISWPLIGRNALMAPIPVSRFYERRSNDSGITE